MVASEGRFFQMMEDGHFSFQDDELSGDVKHAPPDKSQDDELSGDVKDAVPDAQAPTEEEARAAAKEWLRLTGFTGGDPYTLSVGGPAAGARDVTATPVSPANQVLDHPSIFLLVTSDGGIAQVSGYWPTIDAESGYPLHSAEQLLINLKNLRGEFNFLELIGGKDQPLMLADRLQDASATVESVEVAYTLGIAENGQPYLLPVYIVRGHLTQEGLAEPVPFATWVPATGPTAGPREIPQVPQPLAEFIALRDALPLPKGATIFNPGYGTDSLITTYAVQDEQEAVAEFYRRELPAQGWQSEEPPFITDASKPAEFREFSSVISFVHPKDDLRVAIVLTPNEKDASLGATLLSVVVERR
jgi:hypothetical protein